MERRSFITSAATSAAALAIASLAIPAAAGADPALPNPAVTPTTRGEDWGDLLDVVNEAIGELREPSTRNVPAVLGLDAVALFAQRHGQAPMSDETIARLASALELQAIKLLAMRDDLHATAAAAGRPIEAA